MSNPCDTGMCVPCNCTDSFCRDQEEPVQDNQVTFLNNIKEGLKKIQKIMSD
jgi:hypothetical protein